MTDDQLAARLAGISRKFNVAEHRDVRGRWTKGPNVPSVEVAGPGGLPGYLPAPRLKPFTGSAAPFNYEGPPGGPGHVQAIMAAADAWQHEAGKGQMAQMLRDSALAMYRRDMPTANRHLDSAAWVDQVNEPSSVHRPEIEGIRKSYGNVPKRTTTPAERDVGAVTSQELAQIRKANRPGTKRPAGSRLSARRPGGKPSYQEGLGVTSSFAEPHYVITPQGGEQRYRADVLRAEAAALAELQRAFDPREAREPHSGKWTRAEREAEAARRFPLGSRVSSNVITAGGNSHRATGVVVGHKRGSVQVKTDTGEGILDTEMDNPYHDLKMVQRAFSPGEARDPHSGKWIVAGRGLADSLHGKPAVGRHENGMDVHGTYAGRGYMRPAGGGPPIPVTHVRPADKPLAPERTRLPVGAGPLSGGPFTDYARRTAETPTASTVHEPIGKPGGPGLWKHKTWQLPAYIQHVAKHLITKFGESRGIEMAVGIVKNWAAGHDGKGHAVHPDVQAAAAKNIAEWEALKARTRHGASRSTAMSITEYDYDPDEVVRQDTTTPHKPYGDVPYADPGYLDADGNDPAKSGKRPKKRYPIDPSRVQAAWSYINKDKNARQYKPDQLAKVKGRIKAAMKKHGHEVSEDTSAATSASRASELFRYWPLEECRIMRADEGREYASGRVVEAYAAVYDTPAEIRDHEGHYKETIDRDAFFDTLRAIHPDRNNGFWRATCLYNHGMTVHGTPAERFSLPAGVPQYIGSEGKGLLTRTEYANTPLGEELLELVSMGALRSQSFTGGIIRSDPQLRAPGDRYRKAFDGALQLVRRLKLGLREYGLTPFAAYSGAEVLGVRMQLPGGLADEGGWEDYESEDTEAPDSWEDGGPGGSPEDEAVSRSTGNRLYRLRTEELLRQRGIELP